MPFSPPSPSKQARDRVLVLDLHLLPQKAALEESAVIARATDKMCSLLERQRSYEVVRAGRIKVTSRALQRLVETVAADYIVTGDITSTTWATSPSLVRATVSLRLMRFGEIINGAIASGFSVPISAKAAQSERTHAVQIAVNEALECAWATILRYPTPTATITRIQEGHDRNGSLTTILLNVDPSIIAQYGRERDTCLYGMELHVFRQRRCIATAKITKIQSTKATAVVIEAYEPIRLGDQAQGTFQLGCNYPAP